MIRRGPGAPQKTSGDQVCRWLVGDPPCRCPGTQAFPNVADVPPFCMPHLSDLEPWVTRRAALRGGNAQAWIDWARRGAEDVDLALQALGDVPRWRRRRKPTR